MNCYLIFSSLASDWLDELIVILGTLLHNYFISVTYNKFSLQNKKPQGCIPEVDKCHV